jgi:adenosylmethionine-8-amino-7-oxononanoate aminotransferase
VSRPTHAWPDSPVFYRRLDRAFPLAVSASGCWIRDESGREYLDASGGALAVSLGHGEPAVAEEMARAAAVGYLNGTQFTHRWVEELAAELAEVLPGALDYFYFLGSGSEAVEAAVKLARQLACERGEPERWKVVHRVPSYHGNTLTALSLSGRERYRRLYRPLLSSFPAVPAPDPLRRPDDDDATAAAFERLVEAEDPRTIAAFLFEPVLASSGGAVAPSRAHYERIAACCRRHGILLIADEIVTGMGRTGAWLACEHYDLAPDIAVLGKGLSNGTLPLSALAVHRDLVATLAAGGGAFEHAQTFSHTPVICAAGLATVRRLRERRLPERAAAMERPLLEALDRLRRDPRVGDVRGRGLLAAVELVADARSLEPLPRARRTAERLAALALDHGLVVWPSWGHVDGGHVDGERGDLVMVAPPLTIEPQEISEIAARLAAALEDLE